MGVAKAALYNETILAHEQAVDKSRHINILTWMTLAKLVYLYFSATEIAKED